MDKAVLKGHFDADLDIIAQDILNLDMTGDFRTIADEMGRIKAKLDDLLLTKSNLDSLVQAFTN